MKSELERIIGCTCHLSMEVNPCPLFAETCAPGLRLLTRLYSNKSHQVFFGLLLGRLCQDEWAYETDI